MKLVINPQYSHLQSFMGNIENYFQDSDVILHDERNQIRIISYENQAYVVKAFRVPNLINRFAYRYLRASKAQRSYQYSLRMGERFCPQAVAYCECYSAGLLAKSYYVSHHFDYDFTIRSVLNDKTLKNRQQILNEFAQFTYDLHQQNILHRDFSPGNILIKKHVEHYQFKIVDVNRMQFKVLNRKQRLSNFARLMADEETLKLILYAYATCINYPPEKTFALGLQYQIAYIEKRALKNKLRGRT